MTTQAKHQIIKIASQMIDSGNNGMPSQFIEDWGLPKSLSRKTVSKIIYVADCADEQCKAWASALTKIADECIPPMTWTDATPSDELLSAASELLELLRDGYRDDATAAAFERLENAVNAVTASKIAPSPAGSWRKADEIFKLAGLNPPAEVSA